jgi:arginyl-tRNA synthetase
LPIGDEATLAVWQRFRDLSIAKYREVYARLNVKFDIYAGESLVQSEGMAAAMDILREKELLVTKTREESDPTKWKRNKRKAKEPAPGMMKADEHENIESDVHPDGDTAKDSLAPLALAVDLSKWKLEKPVVQKPGLFLRFYCKAHSDAHTQTERLSI